MPLCAAGARKGSGSLFAHSNSLRTHWYILWGVRSPHVLAYRRAPSPSRWSTTTTSCVIGLAHMLDEYRDRVVVAELDTNEPLDDEVDVVLYDSFAQPESDHDDIAVLIDNPRARHVVVYTWNFHPALVDSATAQGVHGYLSKTLPARDLVAAIEAIARRRGRHQRPAAAGAAGRRARLARAQRGPHRPRGRDPRAHHPGQEQRRGRRADVPQPEHRQVLHPLRLSQDRRDRADRTPCCGASTTASNPTTTASTTGAADPERGAGCHRDDGCVVMLATATFWRGGRGGRLQGPAAAAEEFEGHRGHLLGVAYRMLGTVADAEDAVQETYLRFAQVPVDEVRNVPGWLTTTLSRICLDELRSARVRRESYVGPWLPEPLMRSATAVAPARPGPDPADRVTLDESVSMALLVLLETLSPAERTALVLHDVMGLSYAEVSAVAVGVRPPVGS